VSATARDTDRPHDVPRSERDVPQHDRYGEPGQHGVRVSGASGIAALVAAGRYAIHHHGAEAGEELWSIEALPEGGAIAHGEQVLVAPHPLPSELEWRARLSPTGRIETLEVDWRVGTRAVRAEHAVLGTRWHARLLHGGHTREQEGDFPPQAEVAFGSHVLHMLAFRRYVLAEGAEHEYPVISIGPPWFAAEPGRQRIVCTEQQWRHMPWGRFLARHVEVSDPSGATPPFRAWLDEHDVVLESYDDPWAREPWMRLTEYQRG
jgi:hypothetical protein